MTKKIFVFPLLLILTGIALFACSDKQDKEPPFLSIETKTVNLLAEATQKQIAIKTNIEDWTISVDPNAKTWLNAMKQGTNLSLSVTDNKASESRKGIIKIMAGNITETITVEQLGQASAILVSSEIYTLPADGGDITLEITANVDYEIIVPADINWVKPKTETRATEMVKKQYAYQVGWNPQEAERRAEIVVKQKNGSLEKKITVIQKAQTGYNGGNTDDIKDDIKVPVSRGAASSFQQGEEIEKSFDSDMTTIYHSSWSNGSTNYFPITLEYFFENQESIDYFIYYPRQEGYNGHFKEVEIWVSTASSPSYVKTMDYDFKGSAAAARVSFSKPLLKPKSIKFVVKSGHGDGQGFAACAEMEFYRTNLDNFDPLTLFTDITCTKLKPGITLETIEKVSNNLYRNIAFYMFKGTYPHEFRIADFNAWPHPDDWAKNNKAGTMSLLDNPTGISVAEGEELIVFVGDTHGYTLSLKVQNLNKPGGDGYGNASSYPLSPGVNKLKMRNKGLGYVFYHTPEYASAPPVKIHFATGKINGYFDSQKHAASDWNKYLNAAVDEYFDVVGKHAHLTFPTQAFKSHTGNNGVELIGAYDDLVRLEKEFMGLMKYGRPTVNRAYFHVMYHSYMYSTEYRTAYNESTLSSILNVNTLKSTPWGPAHEQGHSFQTRPGFKWVGMTEVTNNVHSLYVQTQWGNASRIEDEKMGRFNNCYEKAYYNSFVKKTPYPSEEDVFCKLISLWQLQLYFANAKGNADFYKDFYEFVRISPDKPNAGEQQLAFVKMVCDVAKSDLTDFFKKWGYLSLFDKDVEDYWKERLTITQKQIDQTISEIKAKNYPVISDKIEYICDSNWGVFKNRLSVQQGTATKSGTKITMTGWKNVVAYEVYEGEKLIFVSNKASFNLDNSVTDNTKVFVVAYNGSKTEVKF